MVIVNKGSIRTRSRNLILASTSPRRLSLLTQIGIKPKAVVDPKVIEHIKQNESPERMVKRLSKEKAEAVFKKHKGVWILAADTVVVCGKHKIGKPRNKVQARKILNLLSGRRHYVYGGVCVIDPLGDIHLRCVKTFVTFKRLQINEIEFYLESGEWLDKAGGYAIQGRGTLFVKKIQGSYSNVVGLPLYETNMLLIGLGYL